MKIFSEINKKLSILTLSVLLSFSFFSCKKEESSQTNSKENSNIKTEIQENNEIKKQTSLKINSGEVVVNGSSASDGLVLKEGDEIEASEESDASVVFFDDSISRLKPGTKLKLEVLNSENFEIGESEILINLETGEVWSKVQKQTSPDISFQVKTVSVNAAIRGSALDVSTDGKCKSNVLAAEHTIEIELGENNDEKKELIEGEEAEIIDKELCPGEEGEKIEVRPVPEEKKQQYWFKNNEERDANYQKNLREKEMKEAKELVGALPGTSEYEEKLKKDKKNLEKADENEKIEIMLKIAERQFLEAELLFQEGKDDLAKDQLNKAKEAIKKISDENKDKEDVKKKIKKAISISKIRQRQKLPNNKSYEVKDFILKVELDLAPQDKKEEIQKRILKKKIIDLHDLAKEGDEEETKKALDNFKEEVKEIFKSNPEFRPVLKEAIMSPYLDTALKNKRLSPEEKAEILNEFFSEELKNIENFEEIIPYLRDLRKKEAEDKKLEAERQEQIRKAQEAKIAEERRLAEEAKKAEEARIAEAKRLEEEKRKAEEEAKRLEEIKNLTPVSSEAG